MNKALLVLSVLVILQVNAQPPKGRPGPFRQERNFGECFTGLQTLQPYFQNVLETVEGDRNIYVQNLKELLAQFRTVASQCGIDIPERTERANPELCDQDILFLTTVIQELKKQSDKPEGERNVIAIITTFMGLANQLPRALQDCGPK